MGCRLGYAGNPGPWVVSVSHADAKVAVRWDAVWVLTRVVGLPCTNGVCASMHGVHGRSAVDPTMVTSIDGVRGRRCGGKGGGVSSQRDSL